MRRSFSKRFLSGASLLALAALAGVSFSPARLVGALEESQTAPPPVIAAAGDIACDPGSESFNGGNGNATACRQRYVSDLMLGMDLAAVLPLGDIQYHCGSYEAFMKSYDLSWGRVKDISRPAVGNHEYLTSNGTGCTMENDHASGYFRYFGAAAGDPAQGYYSYNLGEWHLVALNSNCGDAGGCDVGSPQYKWLEADLLAHPNLCTLAYWHIPLFSSGGRDNDNTRPLWRLLYKYSAEVLLTGHDHIYERFAPQTAEGVLDPVNGIRQFVVGTGGSNHTDITAIAANSEVRNDDTFGVLLMTLHPDRYDWQFLPEAGYTFTDSGTEKCRAADPNLMGANPATSATPLPAPEQGTTPFTFIPAADTYVSETKPSTNYGASNLLRVNGVPAVKSYMRFDIRGLPGKVARATLRLYAHTESSSGYEVRAVADNAWQEFTLTYQNAPPTGAVLDYSGSYTAGEWTDVDVTSLITGDGSYSIAVAASGDAAMSLASRNAIAPLVPQLVLDVIVDPNAGLPLEAPPAVARQDHVAEGDE